MKTSTTSQAEGGEKSVSALRLSPEKIRKLLKSHELKITILGLGRIGLPTAAVFAEAGARVTGLDIDESIVRQVNAGECRLMDEPGLEEIVRKSVQEKNLGATMNPEAAIPGSHFIIICVPTPVDSSKSPNYSAIRTASQTVGRLLTQGSIVIVESTVGPGVVENLVGPTMERESGLKAGQDFGLVSCPERSDPGSIMKNMHAVPRIIGCADPECAALVAALYEEGLGVKVVKVSNPKTANAVKLTENLFRDVNIALANEFALLYEKFDIDTVEVINACATKYNFMPHYPGAGVGGPCLIGDEFIYVSGPDGLRVTRIAEYVNNLMKEEGNERSDFGETRIVRPKDDVYALSFDGTRSKFNKILWLSARKYSGKVLGVRLTSNRRVTVTPDHPMLVRTRSGMAIKRANSLKRMDEIPLSLGYSMPQTDGEVIDLVDELRNSGKISVSQVKVKPLKVRMRGNKAFSAAFKELRVPKDKRWEYCRWNYLPLSLYLRLESRKELQLSRNEVTLYTGRGSTCHTPAVFKKNEDFWRFIGYYLSEGCMYEEKTRTGTRVRIKISFGDDEPDLVGDCKSILRAWGLSLTEGVRDGSHSLKISSKVFGLLLETLGCGTNSYNKKLPRLAFFSSMENVAAVLQGLFRGDGWQTEGRSDGRALVGYASTSPELFQGVLLLLQRVGIIPTCRQIISTKSTVPADALRIARYEDLSLLDQEVGGLGQLRTLLQTHPTMIKRSPVIRNYGTYATAYVKDIHESEFDGFVYNMEVEGSHTFVTSFGIITHNCLPSNSYYLITEGLRVGNIPYLIRLAREINDRMPDHMVELTSEALNEVGKTIRGSKIAVLGLTYKPGVRDIQLSPVEHIIGRLLEMGAKVEAYDPMFAGERVMGVLVHKSADEAIRGADCIVVGTGHEEFKSLRLTSMSKIANNRAVIVDGRSVFDPAEAKRAGFAFRGVGRVTAQ